MKAVVFGLCFAFVVCGIFYTLSKLFQLECVKKSRVYGKLKKWYFLLRWFLIGKYHCEFKGKVSRKFFASLHKAFWLFVIFSCTMSLALCVYLINGAFNG